MDETNRASEGGSEPSALVLYAETLDELLDTATIVPATEQEVIMRAKREAADSIRDFLVAADQARQAERCRVIAFNVWKKYGSLKGRPFERARDLYQERRDAARQRQKELDTPAVQATLDSLRALDVMEQQVSQGGTEPSVSQERGQPFA
jgi:hypothetical protein